MHLKPLRHLRLVDERRDSERNRVGLNPDKEEVMPLARVVAFDGVDADRMAEMQREMEGSEQPENVPAKEIVVLHDPDAAKSLVVLFFDNEDDYKQGDEALNAMPAGDTPGQRTSVSKYQVAFRMAN
jgi:DNA-binding transcriptional ArsR family regulator